MYIYSNVHIHNYRTRQFYSLGIFFTVNHNKHGCMVSHSIIRTAHIEKTHKKNEGY